jgi:hypothetical protein
MLRPYDFKLWISHLSNTIPSLIKKALILRMVVGILIYLIGSFHILPKIEVLYLLYYSLGYGVRAPMEGIESITPFIGFGTISLGLASVALFATIRLCVSLPEPPPTNNPGTRGFP